MIAIVIGAAASLLSLDAINAAVPQKETGIASVYSYEAGSGTASGERLNAEALTAAHKTLPFGTKVRVTNKSNGREVVVTINDRGPFVRGRIIDLTPAGARALGFDGLASVVVEIFRDPNAPVRYLLSAAICLAATAPQWACSCDVPTNSSPGSCAYRQW